MNYYSYYVFMDKNDIFSNISMCILSCMSTSCIYIIIYRKIYIYKHEVDIHDIEIYENISLCI